VECGACVEVVDMLLKAHPGAARESDDQHKLLPLHLASSLQPHVFRKVLNAYPAAAAEKDSNGNLPLQFATEHGACVEVVGMLLKAHTDAARERNTNQEFPLFALIIAGQAAGVAQMLIDACLTAVDLFQKFLQDRRDMQEEGSDSGGN
jgi:hypothetical protein